MKKYSLALLILLINILFSSCKNKEKKAVETATAMDTKYRFDWVDKYWENSCKNAGGIGNFIIRHSLADSMISHYDTIYDKDDLRRSINALLNDYWIDSCTIFAISSYLKTSAKYDGIRISFGCSPIMDELSYPGEQYKNTSTLFIYPTTPSGSSPNQGHKDSTEIVIPVTSCSTSSIYIKPYSEASTRISVFNRIYRKQNLPSEPALNDSLSQGVWIDSCVIYFIEEFIRKHSDNLDGVNIKLGAYFGNEENPRLPRGRFYDHQSTIIMVPTSPNSDNPNIHEDNWGIIEALLKKKAKLFSGALNHGELCPKICD